jgi:hypothetical protein
MIFFKYFLLWHSLFRIALPQGQISIQHGAKFFPLPGSFLRILQFRALD